MKIAIFALLLAVVLANSISGKDGIMKFEKDSNPELPFGMTFKGTINPVNEEENESEVFLRLAEELIPMARSKMTDPKKGGLNVSRRWCFGNTGDAFSLCIDLSAYLKLGWEVEAFGESSLYNVTYGPFVSFGIQGNISTSSYPAEVVLVNTLHIIDIAAPTLLLVSSERICASSEYQIWVPQLITEIATNLLQCQRSVPDMTPWT